MTRLRDSDLTETSVRIRIAVPIWLLMLLVAGLLQRTGQISRGQLLFLVWIAGPVVALLLAVVASSLLGGLARGMLGSLIAQGGDPVRPTYSEQDALIAAGRVRDAADSFRSRLVAYPDDTEARIRLATLLAGLGERLDARRQYAAARARSRSAPERLRIATGLADLHRATGDREALRSELARCAQEFPGSAAGEHARRELHALVAEEAAHQRGEPAPGGDAG